jgi:hypothetical protein
VSVSELIYLKDLLAMDERLKDQLIAELRDNIRRCETNTAKLKRLLYSLGDETYNVYPDWDWRWPTEVRLKPAVHRRFDLERWRRSAPHQVILKLNTLYGLFLDQPPSMELWAEEWRGGSNLFYVFMFEKLDQRLAEAKTLAAEVEKLIHAMPPMADASIPDA